MNFLLYALLCLIWGSTWTAIKIGLTDSPPLWSAAFRFLLATIILLILNALAGRRYPQGWRRKWQVAWPGMFTFFGSYSLTYLGSQFISSALASILFSVMPFFVLALMPFMVKDERVDIMSLLGVVVGFAGVVLVFAEPIQLGNKALFGMILLVLSPLCAALGSVSVKAFLPEEPVFPMITLQMGLGALLITICALLSEPLAGFRFTAKSVGTILYLSVLGSIVAFGGYFWLFKRIRLVVMSLVALITPVLAIFVGYLLLDELLKPIDYVGAALVLIGVLIVNLKQRAEH